MGSSPSERIMPLYRSKFAGDGRYMAATYYGQVPGGLDESKITKEPITVDEAWSYAYDEASSASGHEYSGDFGSKGGFVLVARVKADKETIAAAAEVVGVLNYDYDGQGGDPLAVPKDTYCGYREGNWGPYCRNGKVTRKQEATLADGRKVMADVDEDCPQCKGTGRRPLTVEEKAVWDVKIERRKLGVAAFGMDALRRAAQVYDDKWGPVAALAGSEYVWFGGYCPS